MLDVSIIVSIPDGKSQKASWIWPDVHTVAYFSRSFSISGKRYACLLEAACTLVISNLQEKNKTIGTAATTNFLFFYIKANVNMLLSSSTHSLYTIGIP